MGSKRENRGCYHWTDVSHYFAGGGDKKKAEQLKLEDGLRERKPPEAGDYCLIVKPIRDYSIGIPRNIIREAYFGQVIRFYPQLMEVRKFERGKSLRGRNSIERISMVDVKKSRELLLITVDEMPDISLDSDVLDFETLKRLIISYISLYPVKKLSKDDVFGVDVEDYCLVNAEEGDLSSTEERYVGQVVYKHPNMIMVKEYRHGCSMQGAVRSIIRDEVIRGLVKIFKLKMKPEQSFTREALKYENYEKEHGKYLE